LKKQSSVIIIELIDQTPAGQQRVAVRFSTCQPGRRARPHHKGTSGTHGLVRAPRAEFQTGLRIENGIFADHVGDYSSSSTPAKIFGKESGLSVSPAGSRCSTSGPGIAVIKRSEFNRNSWIARPFAQSFRRTPNAGADRISAAPRRTARQSSGRGFSERSGGPCPQIRGPNNRLVHEVD